MSDIASDVEAIIARMTPWEAPGNTYTSGDIPDWENLRVAAISLARWFRWLRTQSGEKGARIVELETERNHAKGKLDAAQPVIDAGKTWSEAIAARDVLVLPLAALPHNTTFKVGSKEWQVTEDYSQADDACKAARHALLDAIRAMQPEVAS